MNERASQFHGRVWTEPEGVRRSRPPLQYPARERCASARLTTSIDKLIKARADTGTPVALRAAAPVTIPVYLHMINNSSSSANSNIPDGQIADPVTVLNWPSRQRKIPFDVVGITRTTNAAWYVMSPWLGSGSAGQGGVTRRRRRRFEHLLLPNPGGGLLGSAAFPAKLHASPANDGVVILSPRCPVAPRRRTTTAIPARAQGFEHNFRSVSPGLRVDTLASGDQVEQYRCEHSAASGCPSWARLMRPARLRYSIRSRTSSITRTTVPYFQFHETADLRRMDTLHAQYRSAR